MRVAKVLLYDDQGSALVLRRSGTHPRFALEPDLPGGIIERGESFEEGLVREVQEEAGITIAPDILELIGERTGYGMSTKRLYKARLSERPKVIISWEHDQYEWVGAVDLHARLVSNDNYMSFAQDNL